MKLKLVETKKRRECEYAVCDDCEFSADHLEPYWSVQKSIGLHERGCPGHKIRMLKLEDASV